MKQVLPILLVASLVVLGCSKADRLTQSPDSETNISKQLDQIQNELRTRSNSKVVISFLAGIAGAIIAAFLYRETQFKKYLLEKRIDVYSDFLKEADVCRRNGLTSIMQAQLDNENFDQQEIPQKILS